MQLAKIKLLTRIPKHSGLLQISKDSQKIEDALNEKLVSLVGSIQKLDKGDQIFLANDYKERIAASIRRAVEQIYEIAGNYVSEFTSKEYFTTRSDIDNIARIAENYINVFYSRIQRFSDPNIDKPIKPEFIVRLTTATITQATMRAAIIAKSQQILTPVTVTTAAFETILDNDAFSTDINTPKIVYVWVTSQDDKVCPICSGYEGQAWDFDNADAIPDIPDDTHPNCRCLIVLSEAQM